MQNGMKPEVLFFTLFGLLAAIPAQATPPIWNGFYVGLSAGTYSNEALPPDFATADTISDWNGGIFGAQFGYMQQSGSFVLGLEF